MNYFVEADKYLDKYRKILNFKHAQHIEILTILFYVYSYIYY